MRNEFWTLKAEVLWFPGEVGDVPPEVPGGRRAAGTAVPVVGQDWDQHGLADIPWELGDPDFSQGEAPIYKNL